jgi:protein-disulfide isomerase
MSNHRRFRWLSDVIVFAAVLVAGFYAKGALAGPRRGGAEAPPRTRTVLNATDYARPASEIGDRSAAIAIVEFSDFQCPFCAALADSLRRFRRTHTNIRILYRHFPLESIHPVARTAATASECARSQGSFEAYHDALFSERARLASVDWTRLAHRVGVRDTVQFRRCLGAQDVQARISQDIVAARELGLTGTPALLIGTQLVEGVPSMRVLDSLIRGLAARP